MSLVVSYTRKNESLNAFKEYALLLAGESLNSPLSFCRPNWLCKRMRCSRCREIRRNYFVSQGVPFVELNNISHFVTIRWYPQANARPWQLLVRQHKEFWNQVYRKSFKYIKCLALGSEDDTPHLHMLIPEHVIPLIKQKSLKCSPSREFDSRHIYNDRKLLGYIYDKNFIVTHLHPDRPTRIRVLTGSRGMKYGFPIREKS